jgi:hypothetical protein
MSVTTDEPSTRRRALQSLFVEARLHGRSLMVHKHHRHTVEFTTSPTVRPDP